MTILDSNHGHEYLPEIDQEDDVRKINHLFRTPAGKMIECDFTPYRYMSDDDVAAWIELGFPGRGDRNGPLNTEVIQAMTETYRQTGVRPPCGLREPVVITVDPAFLLALRGRSGQKAA